jgi:hypothetical protein
VPRRPNSRGPRGSFVDGQCLSQPSGSNPKDSRKPCDVSRYSGRPSGYAGADRHHIGCQSFSAGAGHHLIGYQSSSRKGTSAGADRHYIGCYAFSRQGVFAGADRLFVICHSFSRTVMFYDQAACISLSLAVLILYLLSGSESLEVTFIRPCIRRLSHTRSQFSSIRSDRCRQPTSPREGPSVSSD